MEKDETLFNLYFRYFAEQNNSVKLFWLSEKKHPVPFNKKFKFNPKTQWMVQYVSKFAVSDCEYKNPSNTFAYLPSGICCTKFWLPIGKTFSAPTREKELHDTLLFASHYETHHFQTHLSKSFYDIFNKYGSFDLKHCYNLALVLNLRCRDSSGKIPQPLPEEELKGIVNSVWHSIEKKDYSFEPQVRNSMYAQSFYSESNIFSKTLRGKIIGELRILRSAYVKDELKKFIDEEQLHYQENKIVWNWKTMAKSISEKYKIHGKEISEKNLLKFIYTIKDKKVQPEHAHLYDSKILSINRSSACTLLNKQRSNATLEKLIGNYSSGMTQKELTEKAGVSYGQ